MKKVINLITKATYFQLKAHDKLSCSTHLGNGILNVTNNEFRFELFGSGKWTDNKNNKASFNFSYQIDFYLEQSEIKIEHLRYGNKSPVYLCRLKKSDKNRFVSIQPHLCGEDIYDASLIYNSDRLQLNWKITGPKKDMILKYTFY